MPVYAPGDNLADGRLDLQPPRPWDSIGAEARGPAHTQRMDSQAFSASPGGRVVHTRTSYDAFVPDPLPPRLAWGSELALAVEQAGLALGRLSGVLQGEEARYSPLLLARDAVGGVRSEGRTVRMAEFYEPAATGSEPGAAVRPASNYGAAFAHARERLEELPVSLRLMRELHFILLDGVADPRSTPGEFRRSQNWLGEPGCALSNASYVPPPVVEMHALLDNWERFLHESDGLPALVRLSLAQCQFLAIQPFLDMNALTGAVICPVLLQHLGVAQVPLPVFGRLLERQGSPLLPRVLAVCATGCWEEWLCWHLHAVADAARETLESALRLRELHDRQVQCTGANEPESAVRRMLDLFFQRPVLSTAQVVAECGLAPGEAGDALDRLESAGVLKHGAGPHGEMLVAAAVIEALEEGSQVPGFSRAAF